MTATSPSSAVVLQSGELRLALRPDLGGCIAGLWLGELPVLRSVEPAELTASRPSGCYPLLPYSNRLGFRRFRWQGQEHTTQPNFDDSPHSVHGVGWLRPWTVVEQSPERALIRLVHEGDAHWPFPFEATQQFVLTAGGLELTMTFTNTAAQPQPVGLGWHPYFPKRERSRLHIEVAERWDADAGTQLPTRHVPQPGIDGEIRHLDFDNCFQGWTGAARIRDEKLSLRLTADVDYLVVFTPQTKPYFCVEPVSHVSNAIHMADPLAHGLRAVAPGASTSVTMKLAVDRV